MKSIMVVAALGGLFSVAGAAESSLAAPGYVVVVSKATRADADWAKVVDALAEKHRAEVLVYEKSIDESLDGLRERMPRYVGIVAAPSEAGREFVVATHRLMRRLDDDPYTDALWGIVTGYDPAAATRIVETSEPLAIRRAAAGTEIALECCEEGRWYCELKQNRMVVKRPNEAPEAAKAPDDTTEALARSLTEYKAQLFVTSGHATERDWQIGYAYRNGQFRSKAGRLLGLDTAGREFPIDAPEPKVYLPVGNCLMGHIDGPDAMALAWMNSAGVRQMIGYIEPTWYGYAGWGVLDYFVEQPGRFTLAEAFFANQQALVHRLATCFPDLVGSDFDSLRKGGRRQIAATPEAERLGLTAQDAAGLLFDRDVVAFYGDPAWAVRMAPSPCAWNQQLTVADGLYRFEVVPQKGEATFRPINGNGSQRGGRPIVAWLPHRIGRAEIVEGQDLRPTIADDFLLIPLPDRCEPGRVYRVVFRASS